MLSGIPLGLDKNLAFPKENDTFDTAEHYVVNGFGKSYWDSYKTGDVTVNLYAGWTK